MNNSQHKKFLALGDSYTLGEGVNRADCWPEVLARQIHWEKPIIIAHTGWTTHDLQQAINQQPIIKNFDLVSLLIGVNNQYKGYSMDEYRKEFTLLLKQAIEFAGGNRKKVMVLSIPDYSVTPFGQTKNPEKTSAEIDLYNYINKAVTKNEVITYVDVTGISRLAAHQSELITADQLHPSEKMYKLWVIAILERLKSMAVG